jgi:hypothetical protein
MKCKRRTTVLGLCLTHGRAAMFRNPLQSEAAFVARAAHFERVWGNWTNPIVVGYGVGLLVAFFLWVYRLGTDPSLPSADLVIFGAAVESILLMHGPTKASWVWLASAEGPDGLEAGLPVLRD